MDSPTPATQLAMIETVRRLAQADERLAAVVMYGSFTQGEGDAFSDIEFFLFAHDDALPALDRRGWVAQVAPLAVYLTNEFGTEVAIFENLVRGEFHFQPISRIAQIQDWTMGVTSVDLDAMILLDRTGALREQLLLLQVAIPQRGTPEQVQELAHRFLNWVLFGANVLRRGERARALDILAQMQRYLLWMARLTDSVQCGEGLPLSPTRRRHWPTPSRGAEADLSSAAYRRFTACTAALEGAALEQAYREAWRWGREMIAILFPAVGLAVDEALMESVDQHVQG